MADAATLTTNLNLLFTFMAAILVLLMHVGFAMLEAGSVQNKNRSGILLKNFFAICVGGTAWYVTGYQLYSGVTTDTHNGFMGTGTERDGMGTYAALFDLDMTGANLIGWFFGFTFAATAATIVSGTVAERCTFKGFVILTAVITGWVYPVVGYWAWNANGWLKAAGHARGANGYWQKFGFLDFAGSAVVHMLGATAGLVAAVIMGPRKYMGPERDKNLNILRDANGEEIYKERFEADGTVNEVPADTGARVFSALGALFLWIGWYGFNPGTVGGIAETSQAKTVGFCIINTTLAPCSAVIVYALLSLIPGTQLDLSGVLNVALTGLVSITANCDVVHPWTALIIGAVAGPVYIGASWALKKLKIDDVVDAIPVHGAGGIWGVLVTGLLADPKLTGGHDAGIFYNGTGAMLGWQFIGILCIMAWTAAWTAVICLLLHKVPPHFGYPSWLRITEEEEKNGLDWAATAQLPMHTPASPRSGRSATEVEANKLDQAETQL